MAERITKLKPAPLLYPNGGGLETMSSKTSDKIKQLEHQILDLQTQVGHHKIDKKYAPKPIAPASVKRNTTASKKVK